MRAWGTDSADGQVSRVARRLAIVAASGELARDALDLPWGEDEVETAVQTCFSAWLESRGGAGAGEITAAIEKLRGIIETHESRFLSLNNFDEVLEPRIPPPRLAWLPFRRR
jgi:putative DNA primase/helicase